MKNKTKKIARLACAVLLIIALQAIGFTYAKYISQDGGTGYAEVAQWAFQIDKEGEQTKTVQLVNTVNTDTLVDGKIAPGTKGQIEIILDATGSDVDVDYELKFINEKNRPSNLHFTALGEKHESLSAIGGIKGTINHDDEVQKRTVLLLWEWAYETGTTEADINANDKIDTQDANKITEYTFDIIATGTQKI